MRTSSKRTKFGNSGNIVSFKRYIISFKRIRFKRAISTDRIGAVASSFPIFSGLISATAQNDKS